MSETTEVVQALTDQLRAAAATYTGYGCKPGDLYGHLARALVSQQALNGAPLIVSRFDVAMEPAPEEDQVLTIGAVADDGRPVALLLDRMDRAKVAQWLAPEKDTRDGDQPPAGESTPVRIYVAGYAHEPFPMGWFTNEDAARACCQAKLSSEYGPEVALLFDWLEGDDPDEPRELVARIDGDEQPTGYTVHVLIPDETYDPEAQW